MSDTFAGIRPTEVAAFVAVQLAGAAAATAVFRWLVPALPREAAVVVPRETPSAVGPEPQGERG